MKNRLGKGLDALLGDGASAIDSTPEAGAESGDGLNVVSIALIDRDMNQPRKTFDAEQMNELIQSIKTHGVLQPILLRPENGRYVIIAGERRWRAAKTAGLKEIPAIIREYAPTEIREVALIENLQRVDLNPIEEAQGIGMLIKEYGFTQEKIAERLGKSRPAISNLLRLLTLPEKIQQMVKESVLSMGHARAIAGIKDKPLQLTLAARAADEHLSVRDIEKLSSMVAANPAAVKKPTGAKPRPEELISFEENLMQTLGTRVHVNGTLEKGNIVIDYYSAEDLERIYEKFSKRQGADS